MPEEAIKYNFSAEPTGVHMLMAKEVAPGSKVLDIGCASGYLGEFLIREKQCEVCGVEPEINGYKAALDKGYKLIINQSIESSLRDQLLSFEKFDYILLADVLEHLVSPEEIIGQLKKFLNENGKILISLPNVAHYSIRFSLLRGNWNMSDWGILDRTHLHFYTLKTGKDFIEKGWYVVEKIRPRGDLERWFKKIGLESVGRKLLFWWPEFWAMQFVFTVKRK